MDESPRDMAQVIVGVMKSAESGLTAAELDRLGQVADYLEGLNNHRLLRAEPATQEGDR